jgi:p-cumate 2,3-dioxygenase beta subunit
LVTTEQVEEFLYHEADLLDDWDLMSWAELFTENGLYLMPPTDRPNAHHQNTLFFISDDRLRIVQRAKRLLKKEAHVEYPHSTTCHLYSNIRILGVEDGIIHVGCRFITYRSKREVVDAFVGRIRYKLVEADGQLKILEKRVVLALDALRPQGKVSIIL